MRSGRSGCLLVLLVCLVRWQMVRLRHRDRRAAVVMHSGSHGLRMVRLKVLLLLMLQVAVRRLRCQLMLVRMKLMLRLLHGHRRVLRHAVVTLVMRYASRSHDGG